jgi:hypothetical protein
MPGLGPTAITHLIHQPALPSDPGQRRDRSRTGRWHASSAGANATSARCSATLGQDRCRHDTIQPRHSYAPCSPAGAEPGPGHLPQECLTQAHGVLAMLHGHGIPPDTTYVCIILSPDMSVHTAVEWGRPEPVDLGARCQLMTESDRRSYSAGTRVVHVPYVVEQDEDGVWCASAQLRPGVGAVGDATGRSAQMRRRRPRVPPDVRCSTRRS